MLNRAVSEWRVILVPPGDRYLYVADNNNNVGAPRKLFRINLRRDGTVDLRTQKLIYDWKDGRGADGFEIDQEGRLYVAAGRTEPNQYETANAKGGVYILSPKGKLLVFIPIPVDEVTNVAFGGPDRKTLFVSAGGTLWSSSTTTPGWVRYVGK